MPVRRAIFDGLKFDEWASDDVLNIRINSLEAERSVLAARRATTSKFQVQKGYGQEQIEIAASILSSTDKGQDGLIRLVTKTPGHGITESGERWLYIVLLHPMR